MFDGFLRKFVLPIKWFPVDAPLHSWRLWKCNDSWKGRCRHRTGSRGRVPPVSPKKRPQNWPSVAVLEYVAAVVSVTWNSLYLSPFFLSGVLPPTHLALVHSVGEEKVFYHSTSCGLQVCSLLSFTTQFLSLRLISSPCLSSLQIRKGAA